MGMSIMDMIKLSNQGISAKDVVALNKNGYTMEIINELQNMDGPSLEDLQNDAEEQKKKLEDEKKKAEEEAAAKKATEEKLAQLLKDNEDLKKQLADLQAKNRGGDMGDDLPDPSTDAIKNVTEIISNMM